MKNIQRGNCSLETSRAKTLVVALWNCPVPPLPAGAAIPRIPLPELFVGDLPADQAGEVQNSALNAASAVWSCFGCHSGAMHFDCDLLPLHRHICEVQCHTSAWTSKTQS
jgi:hypothetical protein